MDPYRRRLVAALLGLLLSSAVSATEPLRLGTDDWPPYEYLDPSSGQITGFSTEMVLAVMAQLGAPLAPVRLYPWARAEREAQQGALDGLFTLTVTPERRRLLHYPDEPLHTDRGALFIRRTTPPSPVPTRVEDLARLTLGTVRGYAYSPEIRALLTGSERVIEVANETQLFRLLARGRVDAVLTYRSVGQAVLRRQGLNDDIAALDSLPLFEARYFIAFNRQRVDAAFVARFSGQLRAFKTTPAYTALLRKYFPAEEFAPTP